MHIYNSANINLLTGTIDAHHVFSDTDKSPKCLEASNCGKAGELHAQTFPIPYAPIVT
jgi:hypothetical protein